MAYHARIAVAAVVETIRIHRVGLHLDLGAIAAWTTSQTALVLEEMRRVLIDGPVVALARLAHAHALGQLLEALVQAEIVSHRILPAHVGSAKELIAAGRDWRERDNMVSLFSLCCKLISSQVSASLPSPFLSLTVPLHSNEL